MKKTLLSILLAAAAIAPFSSSANAPESSIGLDFPQVLTTNVTLSGMISSANTDQQVGSANLFNVKFTPDASGYFPPAQDVNVRVNLMWDQPLPASALLLEVFFNEQFCDNGRIVQTPEGFVFENTGTQSKEIMSLGSQFTVKLDLQPTDNPSPEPFSLAHNGYKNSPVASVVFKDGDFVANAPDGRQAVLPFSFKSVTEPDQKSALVKALVHFPGDVFLQQNSTGTQLTLGF